MVETTVVTSFKNGNGSAKLSKIGNSFVVTVEPLYGENVVNSHSKQKKAEIDYSYFVHYFTSH